MYLLLAHKFSHPQQDSQGIQKEYWLLLHVKRNIGKTEGSRS